MSATIINLIQGKHEKVALISRALNSRQPQLPKASPKKPKEVLALPRDRSVKDANASYPLWVSIATPINSSWAAILICYFLIKFRHCATIAKTSLKVTLQMCPFMPIDLRIPLRSCYCMLASFPLNCKLQSSDPTEYELACAPANISSNKLS